jgi:cytoskeletal protein CcmA (bactofilin family)
MFSKKPKEQFAPPVTRPQVNRPMTQGPTFSILGADMAIKGDVVASAELHIDGKIEGDVSCASLVQGEASEVFGAIKAGSARLAGTVQGTITVGELTILRTAQINGDVFYDTLTMEPGAQVDGRLATRQTLALEPAMLSDNSSEPVLTLASSAS